MYNRQKVIEYVKTHHPDRFIDGVSKYILIVGGVLDEEILKDYTLVVQSCSDMDFADTYIRLMKEGINSKTKYAFVTNSNYLLQHFYSNEIYYFYNNSLLDLNQYPPYRNYRTLLENNVNNILNL